ncbi:hypothetical protein DYI37_10875 [Fulvimarina endophytica]|uniref:MxaH protein n=1 Tax=Fulvimarina endophytica TaxID=2293836 RepID=A0A371X3A5_9HYPH|nr:hypothetical protein [Fulvimarina endophytica]RFC63514.1 hypothetical protein DYI37_10875 [Fulvimarina endophytica]
MGYRSTTTVWGRAALLALPLGFMLAACDDPPVVDRAEAPAPREPSEEGPRWQTVKDTTPTPLFLARAARHDARLGEDDPEVARYDRLLREAERLYTDSPRMISNRLIQGSDYLAGQGRPIGPDELLLGLEAFAGERRRSFADDMHHYLNLRDRGAGHEDAIASLEKASGPQ